MKSDHGQSGQAILETAIFILIAILLLAAIAEFGWAYFRYLAMQNAAGEGAAYGIIHPDWWSSDDNPDPNNIVYRTIHESNSPLLDWSSAEVTVTAPFLTPGNFITVTISMKHRPITPIGSIVGDGITLKATAVQRIISPIGSP